MVGAVRAGAVPAVVSDLYKAPDLLYFLRDTAVRFLFIDADQLGKLAEIKGQLPASLQTVIVRGEVDAAISHDTISARLAGRRVVPFAALRDSRAPVHPPCPRHRNDVAYMFYSGGTTGAAKGITHLAHDFYLGAGAARRFWEYREDDVVSPPRRNISPTGCGRGC